MNYHTDAMLKQCKVGGALPSAGLTGAVQPTRLQLHLQCPIQWAQLSFIQSLWVINLTFFSQQVAQLCQGSPNITSNLMQYVSLGPDLA